MMFQESADLMFTMIEALVTELKQWFETIRFQDQSVNKVRLQWFFLYLFVSKLQLNCHVCRLINLFYLCYVHQLWLKLELRSSDHIWSYKTYPIYALPGNYWILVVSFFIKVYDIFARCLVCTWASTCPCTATMQPFSVTPATPSTCNVNCLHTILRLSCSWPCIRCRYRLCLIKFFLSLVSRLSEIPNSVWNIDKRIFFIKTNKQKVGLSIVID